MNLVDKKHIVGLQRGEQTCQITRLVKYRTRSSLDTHPQLVSDDIREGRFSQAWRTIEKHMVERLTTFLGGSNKDLQVLHHLLLAGKTVEPRRTQSALYIFLLRRNTAAVQFTIHGAKILFFIKLTK